jgi:ferredoxin-NADP reductase/MOSC domain-containing protein YiiM
VGERAGRLISVNVGLPVDVTWQGRTVRTAVWKRPVEGPRLVRRLNIDGDGQGDLAGHGGEQRAVFVYQLDSYGYWQRELGRDDFEYGQFGENFTVDGLADAEVCIGDRYRIGDAEFEVTQPRVTCYRVGLRMNEPRMPALLVSHHRPGFYLRVLREGKVHAGDEIIKLVSGPEALTVAEVDALLYLPGHSRPQIERALRVPALSSGWQASFQAMLAEDAGPGNAGLAISAPAPAWDGFRSLTVVAIERESDSVISISLATPNRTAVPLAQPGQYLTVRLRIDPVDRPVLRSYSLSGSPAADHYRISVKRELAGVASVYLHTHTRVGDLLEVAAPRGTFLLRSTKAPVVLISAGVGATPVLAMLHALASQHSRREIWWLHGATNRRGQPFAAESETLLASLPDAHRYICYSRPGPDEEEGRDFDRAGRLTSGTVAALGLPVDAEAYICGPAPFMDEISAALAAQGMPAANMRTELFGPNPLLTPGIASVPARPPHQPPGRPDSGSTVEFARSGLGVRWSPGDVSLLDLAEACDVPVQWSCRTGVCHTCETGLVSGAVDYDPEPVERPAPGSLLICCSKPRGDVVLDL